MPNPLSHAATETTHNQSALTDSVLADTVLTQYEAIINHFPNFEKRTAQETMVLSAYEALMNEEHLVVEAGTGSGKSFGYLIPALLQPNRPIVISTGTIALQEQLLQKDLPFLLEASGKTHLEVALAKGRGNYLCIQKMLEWEKELGIGSGDRLHIQMLKAELHEGWDGDIATLDHTLPRGIWDEIRSDSEDCLGPRCSFFRENPYKLAKEALEKADIIIANHALYLQDMASAKGILPHHEVVIFDEAHQLKNYALNALTSRIGKFATTKLLRKIHRRLQPVPDNFLSFIGDSEARLLQWLFRVDRPTFTLRPDAAFFQMVDQYVTMLKDLLAWIQAVDVKQLPIVTNDQDMTRVQTQRDKLLDQLSSLLISWEYFLLIEPEQHNRVNWAEVDADHLYYELKSTPLNIAEIFASKLWPSKTAILTSATLSTNQHLGYFKKEIGLTQRLEDTGPPKPCRDLILESPFQYPDQCVLYLPKGLPDPNDPLYPAAIMDEIKALLHLSQGRAFVLFTSVYNMQRVAQSLIPNLPYPCKIQGDLPRHRMIQWFKETPNSVLFATSTFWEGIDIPGSSLSSVIMDKIPFTAPDDPIHQASVDALKRQSKDWFNDYALPQAIIKIKQGFGRLIRTQNDKGVVAILDPRLQTKGYGKTIIRSLPPLLTFHRMDTLSFLPEWLDGTEDLQEILAQTTGANASKK